MIKNITVTVSIEERLDKFLAGAIGLSRTRAKKIIQAGLVQSKQRMLKANTILPLGTILNITLPTHTDDTLQGEPIPLNILHDDKHIIVLNKQPGLVVHPATSNPSGTLVNALLNHYPALVDLDDTRPGIVHRLDKDTSGVMVVAKTKTAWQHLKNQFKNRTVQKIYLALVHGHPQVPHGIIDVPIGRHPYHRRCMAPVETGKPAQTHFTVLQNLRHFSLLSLDIKTGRTHQIRVHLNWLGYPIVGDMVYGQRKTNLAFERQFLHAYQLSFTHPNTEERLIFKATLPPDLKNILDNLDT
ncbi:MAG: hypothetical protein B6242_08730 [Anaerolineaceae bacterium 4572_78]|nr:MAG: hypothetical protein B6242_08730 [Anaerolineaceae bacterium 4572_78]